MMYLSFVSSFVTNLWMGIKNIVFGIQNLNADIFEGLVNLISSAKHTFDDLGMVATYVNRAFNLATSCVNLLPPIIRTFAVVTVAVLVAFQIAGRTGGAK